MNLAGEDSQQARRRFSENMSSFLAFHLTEKKPGVFMETSPKRKCSCSGTFASLVSRMLLLLSVFTHLGGGCSGDEKEDSTNNCGMVNALLDCTCL